MVGVTTTVPPAIGPGFQVYVVAPDDVKVSEVPAHTVAEDALAVTVGVVVTVSVTVRVFVQPVAFVPVTV